MNITTKHQPATDTKPATILARGAGKQRTVAYDPSKSADWSHGNAAGVLGLALGLSWSDNITREDTDTGIRFNFPG